MNEVPMIKLLLEKYEAEVLKGDAGNPLKIRWKIDDLTSAVASRLGQGEALAIEESAQLLLVADAFEQRLKAHEKKELNEQAKTRLRHHSMECGRMVNSIRHVMCLTGPEGTEKAVEAYITKLELEKSVAK